MISDSTALILMIPLTCLIIASAFFSGAETAYSSVSYSKIEEDVNKGKRAPKLIAKHYKSFGRTLSTILICNNLVNVLASALITMIFNEFIHSSTMVMLVSTFVMTPIIVAFGEITPKLLAKKYSYGYLKKIVFVMETLNILFFPITYPISKMTLSAKVTNTENELKTIIGLAAREGVLEKREATLAQNALDLDSTKINEIFTKKDKVISMQFDSSIEEAKNVFRKSGHSRIPVVKDEKFIGVVIIKDIVFLKSGSIEEHIIKIPNISKNMNTTRALELLRVKKSHIGFVTKTMTSEQILGIVTLEDMVEELIGEIYDEHDKTEPILQIGLHKYLSIGSASILKLQELLGIDLEVGEDTEVKKWLSSRINRKIKTNLVYKYKNKLTFKIISNKNGEETKIEIKQK